MVKRGLLYSLKFLHHPSSSGNDMIIINKFNEKNKIIDVTVMFSTLTADKKKEVITVMITVKIMITVTDKRYLHIPCTLGKK